ncbi:cobalamin-binding protein [Halomonas aquatica]|uniref:Cobalamin-binding protein n=1 Tax=Halomonas aquatica TaxID=3151123 RepID=A0ABV1NHB4_9GAMM
MLRRLFGWSGLWLALLCGLTGQATAAEVCAIDDADHEVCLAAPAERIVALSPSITELLYAAGAGERLVGTVGFSDYPPAAIELPRVGSHERLDLEALLVLEPDLVVAWISGNPREQLDRLRRLGIPLFLSETRDFEGVADSLERLGRLAGSEASAAATAAAFREDTRALRAQYRAASPVPVFYQVWEQPLMTINGEHWISQALALCGGENVFAEASAGVPRVGIESVLARDPEAILTGGAGSPESPWLESWRDHARMTAVRRDNLFVVDPSLVQRATPRLLEGTRKICEHLEVARDRR